MVSAAYNRTAGCCQRLCRTCFLCLFLIALRKLEKVLNTGSQFDSKLKYLTGEWFYEAKSRRHTDKIHGSDIILASMKQRKAAGLGGFILQPHS